ncbi:SWIM zinc finger family protein [Streptomyces sp. NPDC060000]|uniref:SWIM zinc finger family protein n=1 Tax=Streptomyces sp. NPDC060000 TaxID=3347031 RepID=UPI00369B8995
MGETEKDRTATEDAVPAEAPQEEATSPADEARRALRAARERSQEQEPARESSEQPGYPTPRPADAARAALRRTAGIARTPGIAPAPDPTSTPESVPESNPTPMPGSIPAPGSVPEAGSARTAGSASTPGTQPVPDSIPTSGSVPTAGSAPASDSTPTPEPASTADTVTVPDPTAVEPAPAASADPAGASTPREDASSGDAPPKDFPPADAESLAPQAAPGSRPGDIAREALRAARAQVRQGAAEGRVPTGHKSARGGHRPRTDAHPPEARRPNRTRDPVAEERARVVRELLAGAFQMPSEDSSEPEAAPGNAAAPEAAPGNASAPEAAPGNASAPEAASGNASAPEAASRDAVEAEAAPSTPGIAAAPEAAARNAAPPATRNAAATEAAPRNVTAPEASSTSSVAPGGAASAHFLASEPHHEPHHAPRSMAAPARDGDHRRTFPAFPPRAGGSFAGTWWGNAWVTALEEGALDPQRLVRGRGYAEQGNVDAITVTPGLVLAYVQGSRPRPYRVQVRLRTLGNEDWERFLEAAVERPGHIAALLDKEMPESLAECGVPLLPGPGDLEPQCSCPDRGHPCKHAAALCYQTARLLDADPFVLLLLRGRGEREVLDALSRRNATRAARAAQEQEPEPLPSVRAAEALAERRLPPLPAPLPVPPHPEQPPAYPSAPNGPDSFALDHLATDAAARAHALLATGHDEIGELDLWRDAVRLAASRPGSGLTVSTRALYAALASAVGRTPSELARAVAAWRQGGPDGLTVLEETWDPPAGRFDRARPLLLAADLPAFRPSRNHLTHPRGHVQLRFGRNGLWYAYESEPGHDDWWPRGTPDPDPVGALTGLGGSDEF